MFPKHTQRGCIDKRASTLIVHEKILSMLATSGQPPGWAHGYAGASALHRLATGLSGAP